MNSLKMLSTIEQGLHGLLVSHYIMLQRLARIAPSLMMHDDRTSVRLGLRFTGDGFSLFQKSRHAVGVPFVRFVTERVTQLVADRKIKEALPVHVPLQQQFGAARWYLRD